MIPSAREQEQELRAAARRLLESGTVKVVIGYASGAGARRRPFFARRPHDADTLVHDEGCRQNLAVYLTRPEVRLLGRAAVVAGPTALRAVLQLAAERQIREEDVLALAVGNGSGLRELTSLSAIEADLAAAPRAPSADDQRALERLAAMSVSERRAYWAQELGRCLKCYACRASCPLCYCERCTVDCNRPQWVPVASHALGNLEYHLLRAMHLAGRCVQCGTCGAACPMGIPVHLLTIAAEQSVRRHFGQGGGDGAAAGYALSSFRPDDREDFIR